eukprot:SAG22_NODE_177_length_16160_cov_41.299296_20_plen_107_part_00
MSNLSVAFEREGMEVYVDGHTYIKLMDQTHESSLPGAPRVMTVSFLLWAFYIMGFLNRSETERHCADGQLLEPAEMESVRPSERLLTAQRVRAGPGERTPARCFSF